MAKLSSTERKRRQIYRSEVLDQVPFALKRMDDPAPTIDFTPSGGSVGEYTIERPDVECKLQALILYSSLLSFLWISPYSVAYMETLDSLQLEFAQDPRMKTSALKDIRDALMKLIDRMDGLEEAFERTLERSSKSNRMVPCALCSRAYAVLSGSRLSTSRRRCEYFNFLQ
jgi:autophagy-related protein 11